LMFWEPWSWILRAIVITGKKGSCFW
jgi:hypothetical protein